MNRAPFGLRVLAILVVLMFAGSAVSSEASAHRLHRKYQDTIKRTFDVRPGGTLYIDIDHGNVEIETSDDDRVYVVMERDVEGVDRDDLKDFLEQHEYNIAKDRDGVVVESRFNQDGNDGRFGRWKRRSQLHLEVTVIVPASYNVEFRSGLGDVVIAANETLNGRVEGRTGAGNVRIGKIEGPIDVKTGSGNVEVAGARGRVSAHTGAGNITLKEVTGEIQANTGVGDIVARMTRQPENDSQFGTGAGNVTVYMDDAIAVDVDAHTGVGSASSDFGLKVRGKWMSKSFEGELNGGGPALTMRSGVGSVSLKRM